MKSRDFESGGAESDSSHQGVEIVDDTLIEAIELGSSLRLQPSIGFDLADMRRPAVSGA